MRDYEGIGWQYARDVTAGLFPAGKWTVRAAQRSLDDLASLPGYRWDATRAARVCAFVERLCHVKGHLGGTLIHLEPWQIWVISQTFGWVCASGHREGRRRFRTAYLEVARGNAKSTLTSGIGLYLLSADGEYGAEITSSATTSAQARLVFDDARAMTRQAASAKLIQALGIQAHAHSITVAERNSRFQPTSSEYGSLDGLNSHGVLIDELHAHPDRGLWDVLVTGAGKRPQSLVWAITTAGSDRSGICYEQREYAIRIIDRVVSDETFFASVWSADDDDDWQAEATWRKANPNLGVSVEPDYLAGLAAKAVHTPAAQAAFRTKHLCQWISTDNAWMDMLAWNKCHEPGLDIAEFEGQPCIIGLDLASKVDVAAKIKLFYREIDGLIHYYVFGTYYLPQAAITDGRNAQYPGWQVTGQLITTPGDVVDFQRIEDDLLDDASRFDVEEIAYDPWQAEQLSQRLTSAGAPSMIEYRPTVMNFSAPMKEVDALVRSKRLHFNDPILTWMVSNVVCHVDNKDNIFPKKLRPENKIDGLVALLMALGRAMSNEMRGMGSLFQS